MREKLTLNNLVSNIATSEQINAIDVIGGLSSLTTLQLVVTVADSRYDVYAGELNPHLDSYGGKKPRATKPFSQLRRVELVFTRPWFDRQYRHLLGGSSSSSSSNCDAMLFGDLYNGAGVGGRGPEKRLDACVADLLEHRADLIEHLDMAVFRRGSRGDPPLVAVLAGLTKVRWLRVPADFLDVAKGMTLLEQLEVTPGGAPAEGALRAAVALPCLRRLRLPTTLHAQIKADPGASEILANRKRASSPDLAIELANWLD